jgi:hypothetical protein
MSRSLPASPARRLAALVGVSSVSTSSDSANCDDAPGSGCSVTPVLVSSALSSGALAPSSDRLASTRGADSELGSLDIFERLDLATGRWMV